MVVHCIRYGDDINTDLIIAGKYTKTLNINDLRDHCMEDLDLDFHKKVGSGAIVVAGSYFGCGSSREQAPEALKASGIQCVIAKSFARIFYRNAINIGLPILECDTSRISDGDIIQYELGDSEILNKTTGEKIPITPLPDIMVRILKNGGVVQALKKYGNFKNIQQ